MVLSAYTSCQECTHGHAVKKKAGMFCSLSFITSVVFRCCHRIFGLVKVQVFSNNPNSIFQLWPNGVFLWLIFSDICHVLKIFKATRGHSIFGFFFDWINISVWKEKFLCSDCQLSWLSLSLSNFRVGEHL